MNILFDHQTFTMQQYGGISRYFFELMTHLNQAQDIIVELPLYFTCNHYLKSSQPEKYKELFGKIQFKGKRRLQYIANTHRAKKALLKNNFDVFHPTYYDPYFLKYLGNKPYVLTVYDMTHELFPGLFNPSDPTSKNKKLLCDKAAKIIAISDTTKNDLVKLFGIAEKKIETVYLAHSIKSNLPKLNRVDLKLPDEYILYIGDRWAYKNFINFIKAVAPILLEHSQMECRCIGGGAFSEKEKALLEELNISNKVIQQSAHEETLPYFYRYAAFFVFPSMYEGFGLPLVEAFANHCPVAASHTGSLPEIGSDAVLYFDPMNVDDMRQVMMSMMNDSQLRKQLVDSGKKRLVQFNWDKTAKQTHEVYKHVVG